MILITGSTGRIGHHLVNELVKRGEDVKALVRDKQKITDKMKILPENLYLVEGDITDKNSLENIMNDVDTVYHLAASVDYNASKDLMYKVNVEGTKNMLEVSKGKKFIHMSSTSVMGKNTSEYADESTPYSPTDYYGKTKMEAEKMALKNNAIVIRATDVYGPGIHEGYFQIIKNIQKGKQIIIGSGKNRLQYLHVKDLVYGLIAASKKGKQGEVYLIAGPESMTQKELYETIAKNLNVEPPKKSMPTWLVKLMAQTVMRKKIIPAYVDKLSADRTFNLGKLKGELDFEPKITYEQGLKEIVNEFLTQ